MKAVLAFLAAVSVTEEKQPFQASPSRPADYTAALRTFSGVRLSSAPVQSEK